MDSTLNKLLAFARNVLGFAEHSFWNDPRLLLLQPAGAHTETETSLSWEGWGRADTFGCCLFNFFPRSWYFGILPWCERKVKKVKSWKKNQKEFHEVGKIENHVKYFTGKINLLTNLEKYIWEANFLPYQKLITTKLTNLWILLSFPFSFWYFCTCIIKWLEWPHRVNNLKKKKI